ncbi:hypothetical protein BC936DRAFT_144464 [Jimgerdemannia flammicorona]|uniref:FAD-binding domain-containing protein n=1 Tax=Jimgerdemannia flammicorona TaxID=994334 RepID=A0A433DM08_9FUNG|nr:hypothetical protein BC936DRAFT_144464 [Jimgerdemannia flammicorona]
MRIRQLSVIAALSFLANAIGPCDHFSECKSQNERVDVLVIGAGPVGLFAAYNLVGQGVSVRIFGMAQIYDVQQLLYFRTDLNST